MASHAGCTRSWCCPLGNGRLTREEPTDRKLEDDDPRARWIAEKRSTGRGKRPAGDPPGGGGGGAMAVNKLATNRGHYGSKRTKT
jgi:hypothetical protein